MLPSVIGRDPLNGTLTYHGRRYPRHVGVFGSNKGEDDGPAR